MRLRHASRRRCPARRGDDEHRHRRLSDATNVGTAARHGIATTTSTPLPAQRYNRECFACRAGAELTVGLVHAPGPRGAPTDRSIRTRE
jgi:hypothetical protein